MPNDDDAFDAPAIDDILLVETLMGWDGDRCECVECQCERFRDGSDHTLCPACRVGDHWRAYNGMRSATDGQRAYPPLG